MTLSNVKDYLKTKIVCDNWYVGKIDASKEFCIGIYPTSPIPPVIAVGGIKNTTYATKSVSVLVHWGKGFSQAEAKAREIFNLLFGQAPVIGGKEIVKIDFRTAEPVGAGTDDSGIYEFVINFIIYYKKGRN